MSEACRVEVGEPVDPSAIDFSARQTRQWSLLETMVKGASMIGLSIPDPRDSVVVLWPQEWGRRWFDQLNQVFVWELVDQDGDTLQLQVPWTEVDETSIAFLESLRLDRDQPVGVLGRVQRQDSDGEAASWKIYPFSIFSSGGKNNQKILCAQFDAGRIKSKNESLLSRLREKFKRNPKVTSQVGGLSTEPEAEDKIALSALPILFRTLVLDLDRILTASLESGRYPNDALTVQALRSIQERFNDLGVTSLADCLDEIVKQPDLPERQLDRGGVILQAAYRLELFKAAAQRITV